MADNGQGREVGSVATFSKAVTQADIDSFAQVTGDTNPLHSNAEYAARTRFKAPIAHGMFGAGAISAALGTKLAPNSVVIYLAQNLRFRAPVMAGDTITAGEKWKEAVGYADEAKNAYKALNTEVKSGDQVVISQQQGLKTAMEGVKQAGELGIEA